MNLFSDVGYTEDGVRVGNCNLCGGKGVAADQHHCRQITVMIKQIAEQTIWSFDTVMEIYREWEDDIITDKILSYALVTAMTPDRMSEEFDKMFAGITMEQFRAIAELQLLLLEKGWY